VLDLDDISPDLAGEAPPTPLFVSDEMSSLVGMSLRDIERWAIEQTLKISNGNREETAQILGISERNLYRKLKEFELK
jgi:two-component system response regulator HydG